MKNLMTRKILNEERIVMPRIKMTANTPLNK